MYSIYARSNLAPKLLKTVLKLIIHKNNPHTTKELYSLSDLRLALSCYLAQLHGGEISIELTPDSGYRYLLSLPDLEKLKNNS